MAKYELEFNHIYLVELFVIFSQSDESLDDKISRTKVANSIFLPSPFLSCCKLTK
jgi:hypothetical protein